jgi:flagellar biosynthesis regulator FlbT
MLLNVRLDSVIMVVDLESQILSPTTSVCTNLYKYFYAAYSMIYVHELVERMEEVERSSFCICLDSLINMFRHPLIIKEKEVVWQFMRCF